MDKANVLLPSHAAPRGEETEESGAIYPPDRLQVSLPNTIKRGLQHEVKNENKIKT